MGERSLSLGSWSHAAPSSADAYIFNDGEGHLRCSDAAWPFLEDVPTPSSPAVRAWQCDDDPHCQSLSSGRQCDTRVDDFLHGEWMKHPQESPHTPYIAALHNTSAWKAVEGGRFAHGRSGHLSRCHCNMGSCSSKQIAKWRYRPHTGCSRISAVEGVARLRSRPLTILGDSTTAQYWSALATINGVSSYLHWPQQVVWFCVPESAEQFGRLLRRAGLWHEEPADDDAVLVISLGAWYNIALERVCHQDGHWNRTTRVQVDRCLAAKERGAAAGATVSSSTLELTGQDGPVPTTVTALPEWRAEAAACTRLKKKKVDPMAPDPCVRGRGDLCRVRLSLPNARGGLDQCELAESSARLAAFFSAHRTHLPQHVFVLDSPPTHGSAILDRDNGRWRTRTRTIWQQLAPWVSVLPASEMLVPHVRARSAKVDSQHWCLDSSQMEEYLSSVLTAIVSVVGA